MIPAARFDVVREGDGESDVPLIVTQTRSLTGTQRNTTNRNVIPVVHHLHHI